MDKLAWANMPIQGGKQERGWNEMEGILKSVRYITSYLIWINQCQILWNSNNISAIEIDKGD